MTYDYDYGYAMTMPIGYSLSTKKGTTGLLPVTLT
jgi:hypothetical protein